MIFSSCSKQICILQLSTQRHFPLERATFSHFDAEKVFLDDERGNSNVIFQFACYSYKITSFNDDNPCQNKCSTNTPTQNLMIKNAENV